MRAGNFEDQGFGLGKLKSDLGYVLLGIAIIILFPLLILIFLHSSDIAISIAFLTLAVIVFLMGGRKTWDLFSPVRIFSAVWLGAIGITHFKLSGLQEDWTEYTWIVILASILSYLIGSFSVYSIFRIKSGQVSDLKLADKLETEWDEDRLKQAIYFLFLVATLSYAFEAYRLGIPILSRNPDQARIGFSYSGFVHHISVIHTDILLLIGIYFMIRRREISREKFISNLVLVLLFVLSFLILVTMLNRAFLIWPIFLIVVVYNYLKNRIGLKKVIVLGLIFCLIVIVIPIIRERAYTQDYIHYVGEMKIPLKYSFISHPYLMIAMSLQNIQFVINTVTNFTYGVNTFYPILVILRIKHLYSQFEISQSFNTASYLSSYYSDFGFGGVMLFPFILGVIISFIYQKMIRKPKMIYLVLYAFLIYNMTVSFFANWFGITKFWYDIALMILLNFYCVKKRSRTLQERNQPD